MSLDQYLSNMTTEEIYELEKELEQKQKYKVMSKPVFKRQHAYERKYEPELHYSSANELEDHEYGHDLSPGYGSDHDHELKLSSSSQDFASQAKPKLNKEPKPKRVLQRFRKTGFTQDDKQIVSALLKKRLSYKQISEELAKIGVRRCPSTISSWVKNGLVTLD